MTGDWTPDSYLDFAAPRLRPAVDLLARIPLAAPDAIVDLGCGTGTATGLLAARWPAAQLTGVDASPAMLEAARAEGPAGVHWLRADIAAWAADAAGPAVDLIFSNAALHWLDDHGTLLPTLLRRLRPGGVLAVQMPANHTEPSHTALFDLARDRRWADRLRPLCRTAPVWTPAEYHRLLAPLTGGGLDIWQTQYLHVLEGPDPVARWTDSTIVRPLAAALTPDEAADLRAAYAAAQRAAYPPEADGRTLFPFRRLFLVARP
ncbi:Trans-aconitate 2-methyltransferase [Caenispirillum salinarum AK4]|uniref:Trans-aconitate 2-methyltransferase n=1 Tax=Caenispirillum salinarum AK4 TaxID=1238182 RepID=K9HDQ8_9PROT|nr:methyltransferase domain-containing protein [Caenispirillum salinarum]EKV28613.1 Trans-aconitate 2-methyltransferase [Caenispirillum salinarum AK4]